MKRTLFATILLAAGALAWSPEAKADLVSIGLQEEGVNDGGITTVSAGMGAAGSLTLDYGSFVVSGSLAQSSAGASQLLDSALLGFGIIARARPLAACRKRARCSRA